MNAAPFRRLAFALRSERPSEPALSSRGAQRRGTPHRAAEPLL